MSVAPKRLRIKSIWGCVTYGCETTFSSYSSIHSVTCTISTLEQQGESHEVNYSLNEITSTTDAATTNLDMLMSNNDDVCKAFNDYDINELNQKSNTGLLYEMQKFWDDKFEDDKNFEYLDL
jgi:hypothetical protein